MNEAIQDWYNEKKDYDHDAGQFSPGTGHYTQVVWKGSKELGCGEAMCQNGWEGQKVLYFGDHPYADLADLSLNFGWRTGALIQERRDHFIQRDKMNTL